jgi:membrane glycosyltransferase
MSEKPRAFGAADADPASGSDGVDRPAPPAADGEGRAADPEARPAAAPRPAGELRAIAGGRPADESHGERRHAPERALGVHPERLLHDWREAYERAVAYLAALGLPEAERRALATEAVVEAARGEGWHAESEAVTETLRALRALLVARHPHTVLGLAPDTDPFLAWRLGRVVAPPPGSPDRALPVHDGVLCSMPPLARGAMVPEKLERRFLRRMFRRLRHRRRSDGGPATTRLRTRRRDWSWTRVAHRRRLLLTILVLIPSIIASGFMVNVLPGHGGTWLEVAIVFFFGALFGWISIGFWTAMFGFFILAGRRDRFAVTAVDDGVAIAPATRTAIVMPICAEPVARVFAGLKAIHRSLERAGALEHFDVFVLSDTADPATWVQEEEAWAAWCREVGGFGRIFYRRRRVRLRRKSGNVADFCRRWGKCYRYMIMLDADSMMAGDTLVRLVRMMEARPDVGMIQTAPAAVGRRSLFARATQFAARVYGPMFAAGLHYWQLGDGQYWGHNTIIRVEPFMAHCALPRLPGKPPLGGEILSHDFVEAALMGRAGWQLWLAFDLEGSWEEVPSTLLEEMKRDRRWCQGNLQHLRLLFTEGLFGAHRALFINGVLSYVSALLWFAFISLSTAEAILNVLREPDYFPHGASLFPEWPIWRPDWALYLLAVTAMILFLPKVLSVLLILFKRRNAALYGGAAKLWLSALLEIMLSSLFAPIRMVFHTRFVLMNLIGRTVTWRSQGRGDAETSWGEAIRHHGVDTVVASAWGASLYWLNPDYFWWVTPIITALVLSIPVSVLASRVSLGQRARAWGLFLIPEETAPPPELRDLDALLAVEHAAATALVAAERDGFIRAATDPYANALHRGLLRRRRMLAPAIAAARTAFLHQALAHDPALLGPHERNALLVDPAMVDELHRRVWSVPDRGRAARWGRVGVRPHPTG